MNASATFNRAQRSAAPEQARAPSGGGSTYSSSRGVVMINRAQRSAAPEQARAPSGGGSTYSSSRGLS
jgi:hypothetical protein